MNPQYPYISRKQAEKFIENIEESLRQPNGNPLLHYAYGIGGIGKSTLLKKIEREYTSSIKCIKVSFDVNSRVDTPITLMKIINQKICDDVWTHGKTPFQKKLEEYQATLHKLENEPVEGESKVSKEQKEWVKQLFRGGAKLIGKVVTSEADGGIISGKTVDPILNPAVDLAVDAGANRIERFKKHQAIKNKPELQELIENPIPQFAKASIETLITSSKQKPILLFLDTYEKASSEFSTFLCQFLLADEKLQKVSVRIVIAGRYRLSNKRYQRMFQQYNSLISEKQLDKFTSEETNTYLQEIGITKPNEVRKFWKATKGYPYYLNLIRKQKENGKTVKLSRGGQDIVDLLLDGLSETERKIVILAAYCRWFDKPIIEYLVEKNNIVDKPKENFWFDWLVNLDFVIDDENYRLDDVARDVIRQTEHKKDKNKFTQVHQQLADYYQNLAKFKTSEDGLVDKYENPEWCEYVTESTYHILFANKNKGQVQLLTHFFEGAYFKKPDIAKDSFTAVSAESDLGDYKLLPGNTKSFLQSISLAIIFGWKIVGDNLDKYEINLESQEGKIGSKESQSFKSQVEYSLSKCFKKVGDLQGLAKCFGLVSIYLRSRQIKEYLNLLKQAEEEIEILGVNKYSNLSSFIFVNLGSSLIQSKKYEEALKTIDKAIDFNSNDYAAWCLRSINLSCLKKYGEALTNLDKAINCNSDEFYAWHIRATILHILERYEEALNDFNKAIDLYSDDPESWKSRGNTLCVLRRYEEALNDFNKAIDLHSGDPELWKSRGNTLYILERYEEALYDFHKAIDLHSDDPKVWRNLGSILIKLGKYEEAFNSIDKAIKINHDYSSAWNLLALLLSIQGDCNSALININRAIYLDKDEVLYIANKGIILTRKGDYNEALEFCNQAISKNANHEAGYYAKACYHALQNEVQQAIDNLSKAIDIAPRECRIEAKTNPDFNNLKNNLQFQALLNDD